MTRQDRQRFFAALVDDKLQCSNCRHWKYTVINQQWGFCPKIRYCEDEDTERDLALMSYTFCEAEPQGKRPLDHKLALDTSREFFCCLWEEK